MAGDGVFNYRDGIAVAQLVTFSTTLAFGCWFLYSRRIGWFCIILLSLLRLVGAGCMLGTITNDSDGLWAGVFVCEGLGIILLIFLLLEMLDRVNKSVSTVPRWTFIAPQIVTWIDVGVSVAGFVAVTKVENPLKPTPYSRAGTAIVAFIWLWSVGIFVIFWMKRDNFPLEERRAVTGVAMSTPLLGIRLVYSLIYVITADMTFNAIKGNPTAYLVMTMLPEVGIVALCIRTIMRMRPLPKEQSRSVWTRIRKQPSEEQLEIMNNVDPRLPRE